MDLVRPSHIHNSTFTTTMTTPMTTTTIMTTYYILICTSFHSKRCCKLVLYLSYDTPLFHYYRVESLSRLTLSILIVRQPPSPQTIWTKSNLLSLSLFLRWQTSRSDDCVTDLDKRPLDLRPISLRPLHYPI